MRTRNKRMTTALLLVFGSLLMATMACYSGQVPGVFELTPFYTPTPLADAPDPRFDTLQLVLAPQETGRTFFNLTVDPEPLQPSLVNSKSMCQGDSSAQVLYSGMDHNDDIYYLINCVGSVGWVVEERLAGPLMFEAEELAITVAPDATAQSVELLDNGFRPLPANPLQSCKPETVVRISDVIAADPDGDDIKSIFYEIECPTTGGPLTGWVTNDDLYGPVPIDVDQRAVAVDTEDVGFQLMSEPAAATEDNVVEGECTTGDILTAEEVRLIDDQVYYQMACGEATGWVMPNMFVGPLRYETGINVVVYMPSIPVFADEQVEEEAAVEGETDAAETDAAETDVAETDDVATEATDDIARTSGEGREVIEVTPPMYLTENPGPAIPEGDDANVVAECSSGMVATLEEYAAVDKIYYEVVCNECAVDEAGELVCEEFTGWADQQYLQGPVDFVIGQDVAFDEGSKAVETDESGQTWVRIPPSIESAGTIGSYTKFVGRCPQSESMEVVGIVLEKDRTRNNFSFFYEIQCTGQSSTITEEQDGNVVRPKVEYNDDETVIIGYASGRDLVALDE